MASAIPEDPHELISFRLAILALEEGGRVQAAETLALNPQAPSSQKFNGSNLYTWHNLRRWADELYGDEPDDPSLATWARLTELEPASRP
jgi:hypothetical protein